MARPNADPEETRGRLLAAAAEVFAGRGFAAATVREISARAGSNAALIHYHFGDKLQLYKAVLRDLMQQASLDEVHEIFSLELPPEETVRRVIKARMGAILRHEQAGWHVRLIARELAQPTAALLELKAELAMPLYARGLEVVGALLGRSASDEVTRMSLHSILGQVLFYVLASTGGGVVAEWERLAEHVADFSLAALRGMRED